MFSGLCFVIDSYFMVAVNILSSFLVKGSSTSPSCEKTNIYKKNIIKTNYITVTSKLSGNLRRKHKTQHIDIIVPFKG